jgi:hypothetical protein
MNNQEPDPALRLPGDTYYQLVHSLCPALPPPVPDTPEARVHRDNAAIAQVASVLPASADDANLAALYVAAGAEALECLRRAREYPTDSSFALKWTTQSGSMMRQAKGYRSLLLRIQAERKKREADNAELDKAAWTEHCAIGLMTDALRRTPPVPTTEQPPPPSAPTPAETAEPRTDLVVEADLYATFRPRQAALIRSHGGLPPGCDFAPPRPELLHLIVTGTSPTLRALDSPAEAEAAD